MGAGEPVDDRGGVPHPVGGQHRGAADDDHRRGVEDVLAGCPSVDVLGGLAADACPKLLDEADHRDATLFGRGGEGVHVDVLDVAAGDDYLGRIAGDLAGVRLGGGERRLDVEQAPVTTTLRTSPRPQRRVRRDGRTDRPSDRQAWCVRLRALVLASEHNPVRYGIVTWRVIWPLFSQ